MSRLDESGPLPTERRRHGAHRQSGSHALAGDEIIKSSFADYAFEHYEIAAYKSLLVLAEQLGLPQAQSSLRQSLDEEEKMAAWLLENLQELTLEYLRREEVEMAR
jgi:ferritin-like metal-binding protein YciE